MRLYHELSGPRDAPVLVLSHSLGTNLALWHPQRAALESRFRVLRYDIRGHGRSSVPRGPYSIEQLAGDVVALLDTTGVERAHFCGLSIGGLIGMWLGAHAPERILKLALCNTAARIGTPERWNARMQDVWQSGVQAIAGDVVERWFTPAFREREPENVATARAMLEATSAEGYAACCAAIRDAALEPALGSIRAETLVIAGSDDPATTPADGRRLADAIARARYSELPAAHLSNLEAPLPFNQALLGFLA
jgi:3-oxoadipate enol-lactonase